MFLTAVTLYPANASFSYQASVLENEETEEGLIVLLKSLLDH